MMALVIAGWAGIGKTKLAEKYPDKVIDLESSEYKWLEGGGEDKKGLPGRTLNPDYPQNYLLAIQESITRFEVVCVALHVDIQQELNDLGIPYLYVFAHENDKLSYLERYKNRGNSPGFYAKIDELWDYMGKLKRTTRNSYVVLKENSNLEEFFKATSDILEDRKDPVTFAGMAGVGKTTLGNNHPDRVIDFESTLWKWMDGGSEATKGAVGLEPNVNYPDNYIEAIGARLNSYKVACVSLHKDIQTQMLEKDIPYVYLFPCYWDKEVYAERYRNRGNTDYFVQRVISNWDIIFTLQPTLDSHLIILGSESNLEHYLKWTSRILE